MTENVERVKTLIALKEKLERRVGKLEAELKDLKATVEVVNSALLEKGFRHPAIVGETAKDTTSPRKREVEARTETSSNDSTAESESVIPLRTVSGELLALLYVTENSLRALPAAGKNFSVGTPPFTHFLVERVLAKMQERDGELVRNGQLPAEKMLSYEIVREGDMIREITIRNVDSDRLRELRSSIRWTFEKMHEKINSQD